MDTVERIRTLLWQRDILTVETFQASFGGGVAYHCDLSLGDTPFFGAGFSVAACGLRPRDTLEAIYQKFMAHLSCGALLPVDGLRAGNEVNVPWQSFACDSQTNLRAGLGAANPEELAEFLKGIYGESIGCVPYTVGEGKQALLPRGLVRALCGVTGLCAGNTREEALLHGLMDIYEQYATRKIFQFCFTAPPVPPALFEGTDVLSRIRGLGYAFTICDCSLGKAFPVLGLALTRPDGSRAFAPGAGVSPVLALERSLAVLLQGGEDAVRRRFHKPGSLDLQDKRQVEQAYHHSLPSPDGPWPDSVFGGNPLYPFTGFAAPPFENAAQALRYYLGTVSQYGGTLYSRDCSHLGYPAYEVYMPGASETDLNFTMTRQEFLLRSRLGRHRETVCCLPKATGEALEALVSAAVDARPSAASIDPEPLRWLSERPLPAGAPLRGALLPLLLGTAKRYARAADAMTAYLATEESQSSPRRFLEALTDFWRDLADGRSPAEAARPFGPVLAERCFRSLAEPASLFSPKDWPVCPACGACAFAGQCAYPQAEALAQRIFKE